VTTDFKMRCFVVLDLSGIASCGNSSSIIDNLFAKQTITNTI